MKGGDKRSHELAKKLRHDAPDAERVLWQYLKSKKLGGYKFRRQHPIKPYVADFACVSEKIIVELDGASHEPAEAMAQDARRTAYIQSQGWRVIRFWNEDVFDAPLWVCDQILNQIHSPLPLKRGSCPEGTEGVPPINKTNQQENHG